jgi:spermidine/putrescine transport system substrate-binding protein
MKNHPLTLACYAAASLLLASCAQRETLRIAGLEGGLDSSLIAQFKQEYFSTTGKEVDVFYYPSEEYQLITEASNGKLYDLMLTANISTPFFRQHGLLQLIDHNRIRPLNDYLPYMVDFPFDLGNLYTLPYSYIMVGIVYDSTKVSSAEASSLEVLWDKRFAGHIVLQALEASLYNTAAVYYRRHELAQLSSNFTSYSQAYRDSLQAWTIRCDPPTREAVKSLLVEQHGLVNRYADGQLLGNILSENDWIGWVNHAQAIAAAYKNHNLHYRVPREGSIYCPYIFSITTACKNVGLAYEFLRFISRTDVAAHNMRKNSMPSVIVEAVELCHDQIVNDTVLIAGTTREWREHFFDMFNMPEDIAKRTPLLVTPRTEDIPHYRNTIKDFWNEVN